MRFYLIKFLMETKLAKVISYIFHPLLIPTYALIIMFNLHAYFSLLIPQIAKWKIIGMVFIITCILPLIFIFLLIKNKAIKSIYMNSREERTIPYIITSIFYFLAYYLFKQIQIAPLFYFFILGSTLLIILSMFVNFFWKISIHMIAIGGLLGTLIGLSFIFKVTIPFLILLVILCSGFTGFARLKLNSHNPPQVYIGFFTGVSIMLLLFLLI